MTQILLKATYNVLSFSITQNYKLTNNFIFNMLPLASFLVLIPVIHKKLKR